MFADWLGFASAFSIFLENEISYITRGNKWLNFLEIIFTLAHIKSSRTCRAILGDLAPTQQSKRKQNLRFQTTRNELNPRRDRTQNVIPFPASHAQRTFWVFPYRPTFPSPSALSLLISPKGNSEFCFPETLNVPDAKPRRTLRSKGKQGKSLSVLLHVPGVANRTKPNQKPVEPNRT